MAVGAAQWIPAAAFATQSQRASTSYAFFSSGSLPYRMTTLIASPFLLGTNEGRPGSYAGPYNFPEVTSYMGVLALIAACSLVLTPLSHPSRGPSLVDLVRDPGDRPPVVPWADRPRSATSCT